MHGVSRATLYAVVDTIVHTLHAMFTLDFNVTNPHRVKELEAGFAARTPGDGSILRGVVGALDGIAVKIGKPRRGVDGVNNAANYYNSTAALKEQGLTRPGTQSFTTLPNVNNDEGIIRVAHV